jgi:hypothetical protein
VSIPKMHVVGTTISIKVPIQLTRYAGRKQIILPSHMRVDDPQRPPDETMVKALARAWLWQKQLNEGKYSSLKDLSEQAGINASYVTRIMRLNLLSPTIKHAILNGTQPQLCNLQSMLTAFPACWGEQERIFGFTLP